jgi:hypothetical protein
MGDYLSIMTDGWFQTDGEVPTHVEVFTSGLWNTFATFENAGNPRVYIRLGLGI